MDAASPLLLRRRTGRIGGALLAGPFGFGTILLGALALVQARRLGVPLDWRGLVFCGLSLSPFLVGGLFVALSWSELWFEPRGARFRVLRYRPWMLMRGPAVEEIPASEYQGVRVEGPVDGLGRRYLLSLVSRQGEDVPLALYAAAPEAVAHGEDLAAAAGYWVRTRIS